jgi:hypothetical protein
MKNNLFSNLFFIATLLLLWAPAQAQEKKPRQSPADSAMGKIGGANIKIRYSSPSVKGRAIWGALVPYDTVWRTGANEATTFATDKAITVEGKALPAGTYSFFAIPGKESWVIIFNKTAKQWGAYDYKVADDALRVTVKPKALAAVQERMHFSVTASGISLKWDKLEVPVAVK